MTKLEEAHLGRGEVAGPVGDVPVASRMLTRLENIVARRKGITVQEARVGIARAMRVPHKTLLHIRNQRRKSVQQFLMVGIRERLIEVLQAEIRECEHEIAIHRQIGTHHSENDLLEAEASIAAARNILHAAIKHS